MAHPIDYRLYEALISTRIAHMRLMVGAGVDIVKVAEKIWGKNCIGRVKP